VNGPLFWRGPYLEGSRFTCWQFCRSLAGGSRELPSVYGFRQASQYVVSAAIELRHVQPFPGAACCSSIELQSCKAAPLQARGLTTNRFAPFALRRRRFLRLDLFRRLWLI
jgi:hypothetical protein